MNINCQICFLSFETIRGLMMHIVQSHQLHRIEYAKKYLNFVPRKCIYSKCNNAVDSFNWNLDGTIRYKMFCSSNCQKYGRNKTTAFGNNDKQHIMRRSIKMSETKRKINPTKPREIFDVFSNWVKKYGNEKALELEKCRRSKEMNTKMRMFSEAIDALDGFSYQSKTEKLLAGLFDLFEIDYTFPASINNWLVDFKVLDYFVQFDGIFYHGLDKHLSEIKRFSIKNGGLYSTVYSKFKKDRKLDEYCILNNIKLVRLTDIELTSCLNFVNCWNNFRDQDATTNREIEIVNALKNLDISQSAAKLLERNGYLSNEEGPETIEKVNIIKYLELSRVDFLNKFIETIEKRSLQKCSEDIVHTNKKLFEEIS